MKFRRWLAALFVAWSSLGAGLAQAALAYTTQKDVLFIWGSAESGDVDKLEAKLTPAIRTVVVWAPAGEDWSVARLLAAQIERAEVTTVVHGPCTSYTCAMMFLSGKARMFSGAGRPEAHYLSLSFWETGYFVTADKTSMTTVVEWWKEHTRLEFRDLRPHHDSIFYNPKEFYYDQKVFFPAAAKVSSGNVLHCSGERRQKGITQYFPECMSDPYATALSKGIVTTDELFVHPYLAIKPDVSVPAASNYAKLEDKPVSSRLVDACLKGYEDFLKQDSPRAFVVGESGTCAWRGAQSSRPYAQAIEACQKVANVGSCRFYAIDSKVVFIPFGQPVAIIGGASAPAAAPNRPL